MVSGSGIRYFV